jgi:HSP20 family protein
VATLVRWEPFRELATLQTEMSRLMNGLFEGNGRESQSWVPALDVYETEGEIVYAFDLPGVSEEQVTIELNEDALTVSTVRERSEEQAGEGVFRNERRFGSFSRTVGVPKGVDEGSIKADYHDGVLEVRVAKPAVRTPRRIPVGGAQPQTIEGNASEA